MTQLTLPTICCGKLMWGHGVDRGRLRHRCSKCGTVTVDRPQSCKGRIWIYEGRRRIQLGRHPYANTGGWQYSNRYVMMCQIGRILRTDEHVHHIDLDRLNDSPINLELQLMEQHGRLHASLVTALTGHDHQGNIFELEF